MRRGSGQLLLDLSARGELERELAEALRQVRTGNPEVAGIHARERYRPSMLIVGLEPPLLKRVLGMFDRAGRVVTLRTGNAELDTLNAEVGLRGAKSLGSLGVIFCYGPELNVVAAAAAYSRLDGVSYAEPDTRLGDGPDIEAARVNGAIREADSTEAPFRLLMARRWGR